MMKDSTEILNTYIAGQKVNYDKVLQEVMADCQLHQVRPSILLHSCCAPCSTYSRREQVQKDFVETFNQRTGAKVGFMSSPYEPAVFNQMVMAKGLESELEGGKRCTACFQMRLDIVAEKAQALGFDYFGSALTVSPHKNSQVINEVGLDMQKIYAVNYLPSDFKKNNGYRRSVDMCGEYDIYRQCYCGCVFAAKQQGVDLKAVNAAAKAYLAEQDSNL